MADGPVTVQVTCVQCNCGFEYERLGRAPLRSLCRQCAEIKRKEKTASYWREQARPKRAAGRVLPTHCKACQRALGLGPQDRLVRFCSNIECRTERVRLAGERHRRKLGALPMEVAIERYKAEYRKRPPVAKCKQCDAEFASRASRGKSGSKEFCSHKCSAHWRRDRAAEIRTAAEDRAKAFRWLDRFLGDLAKWCKLAFCRTCGEIVEPERMKPYSENGNRCRACVAKSAALARRKSSRIRKAMDRARLKRVTVEKVDPFKVFDRDGWRCHLCGGRTPKELRGTYKDRAPELDHIVPLSKGGEHSYANTACSCRKCNGAKGDTILGQPSLLIAA